VSDVTAEEVERERERAQSVLDVLDYMPCHVEGQRAAPWADGHWKACGAIATALAVRAREARREALERAEKIAYDAAEKAEDAQGYYGPAAAEADAIADAIRALLGSET
jgi:hypothetical protein